MVYVRALSELAPNTSLPMMLDPAVTYEVGDALYRPLGNNYVYPASYLTDELHEERNQVSFGCLFIGFLAELPSAATSFANVWLANTIVTASCASTTINIGDEFAIDEAASGTALETQKLVKVNNGDSRTIVVATKEYNSAVTQFEGVVVQRAWPKLATPELIATLQGVTVSNGAVSQLISLQDGVFLSYLEVKLGTGCASSETVSVRLSDATGVIGTAALLNNASGTSWVLQPQGISARPGALTATQTVTNASAAANLEIRVYGVRR